MSSKKKVSKPGTSPAPVVTRVRKSPVISGQTVDVSGLALDFGSRRKGSVYDRELDGLMQDTAGADQPESVARFYQDKSVRGPLLARAKKRKIAVEIAVKPEGLYVRLAPPDKTLTEAGKEVEEPELDNVA